MRWSLAELYPSFDSNQFQQDLQRFESYLEQVKEWADTNLSNRDRAAEKIAEYVKMRNELEDLVSRLFAFAQLTLSVEAKNQTALRYVERIEDRLTELTAPSVRFQRWLGELKDLDQLISTSPYLEEHRLYLSETAELSKYLLSEAEEVLIAKMSNTGSGAWSKLQELLTSTLQVELTIDGEQKSLPLPVVRNMAHDPDPGKRRTAYEAELAAYKKIEDSSAACLNGIKGEVITVTKRRGYKSALEKTLLDSRMDREMLDAMLGAVQEYLPVLRKYYRRKAELLGHKNGLPFFDLFAPLGSIKSEFTFEQAHQYIVSSFRRFSDKLADFADRAFQNDWIDAEPRDGKRGGAFCANLHPIKESRILANFTGSFSDVSTLAHELGHAYHGEYLAEESAINSHYPMPLAETASIFAQTLVVRNALQDARPEEALGILEAQLSDAGQVVVDIYSRYLFESEVFKRREDHSLSADELKEIMLWAQKEAYGSGLDHEHLHPYMWVCKPHYYFADANFYNFPYTFGELFARGLFGIYLERGEAFIDDYDRLLRLTGKKNVADVAKEAGIDVRSKEFWRNSLATVEEEVNKFLELSAKTTG